MILVGIDKSLAKPLPDPVGIIAKLVSVLIRLFPISFTEPSPPTAVIMAYLCRLFDAISIACFALSVYLMSTSNLVLSRCNSIKLSTFFCFPIPEIGFIINNMFCLELIGANLKNAIHY